MAAWKFIVGLGLVLIAAAAAFPQEELGDPIPFSFGGTACRVIVRSVPSGSVVILQMMGGETPLCPAVGGENLFPVVQVFGDRFFVMWAHYGKEETGLGIYDSRTTDGRVIPLPGLSFVSSPMMVLQGKSPRGVMILGNSSNNDDIFFLDLPDCSLTNMTCTPASEKWFAIQPKAGGLMVSTATLWEKVLYDLNVRTHRVEVRERSILKPRTQASKRTVRTDEADCTRDNTYIAFGDSITWGLMRMYGLEGEYHPELAYPERMRALLSAFYGPAYPINLGVPGEDTYGGTLRIDQDLDGHPGLYFLLMLGTNDCISGKFSIDSVIENIDYIIGSAGSRRMRVIISTIPPRKDRFGDKNYVLRQIAALNGRIGMLASDKSIGFIDTHKAFMDYDPPDGWMSLLEDTGGNHPSPEGQMVIADLFSGCLAAFSPGIPSGVKKFSNEGSTLKRFDWDPCCESDFAFFRLEFGPTIQAMTGSATTTGSSFSFHDLPSRNFYFRIKTVDKAGHFSPFTRIYTIAERDRHDRQRRHPPEILMQSLLRRPSEEYGRSGSS
jgi:lysophospholipase L1-like esterase